MKNRKIGIAAKLFIIVTVLLIVSDMAVGITTYFRTKQAMENQIRENAMNLARCAAAMIDGKKFDTLQAGDDGNEIYQEIFDMLTTYWDNSGVEFIYTARQNTEGGYEFVVDTDMEDHSEIGAEFPDNDDVLDDALDGDTVAMSGFSEDEWGSHMTAYSPIYKGSKVVGVVGVDLNADAVKKQTASIAIMLMAICLSVFAVGLVVTFLVGKALKKNFAVLNDKIVDLSMGSGDLTKEIDIRTGDELEVIAGNVNHLLGYMRGMLSNISNHSLEMRQTSQSISEHLNAARSSSGEMSEAMETMSSAMGETAASMQQINSLMDGILSAVNGIADSIQDGMDYAKDARDRAGMIGEMALQEENTARDKAEHMKQSVAEKIEKSKQVEQINELTEDILSITAQTNLLALNASIEAARAGEAGKGFAVVAGEIGKLAADSARSASQIQSVSENVIRAVNELAQIAQEMVGFIYDTTMTGFSVLVQNSGDYRETTVRFDQMMRQFSEISSEISEHVNKIRESTNAVNHMVEETNQNVQRITEQSADMSMSMQEIGSEAVSGSNFSDALYQEIRKFKIE